jgi:IS30 family transposase
VAYAVIHAIGKYRDGLYNPPPIKPQMDTATKAKIRTLRRGGLKLREIAAIVNVPIQTISYHSHNIKRGRFHAKASKNKRRNKR